MTDRLHVLVKGCVQGVGFRYTTYRQATALGLSGWVCNTPDGFVEAEFEGSKTALEEMCAWCKRGPSFADVEHVEVTWDEGEARHSAFTIRAG